jgi:hypothetical protein
MSATNRGGARAALDFYSTPAWVTHALLRFITPGPRVLDPCAGDGSILKHLGQGARGYELDAVRATTAQTSGLAVTCRDSLSTNSWDSPSMVIMNPPYSLSEAFVRRALEEVQADGMVCALLRLGWLASKKRKEFHRTFLADVHILSRRPSFTPDGKTDTSEYAWFVWPGQGRWFVLDAPEKG